MSRTIKGFHCRPGLPLSKVLKRWIKLNTEIAEEWTRQKDVPWWYNERAAMSLFAGAVWRSGNVAFEEFADEKRMVSRRTGRFSRSYKGRVDLYLNIESQEFIAEAKQCWSGASAINVESENRISNRLSRACSDIRKSKPYGQRRLAVVFVVPYVRRNYRREIDHRIKQWLKKIQGMDCDALAWVFPSVARKVRDSTFYYPGVALLAKEV